MSGGVGGAQSQDCPLSRLGRLFPERSQSTVGLDPCNAFSGSANGSEGIASSLNGGDCLMSFGLVSPRHFGILCAWKNSLVMPQKRHAPLTFQA